MARVTRVVLPGIPHHVTQRGNRHQKVFFGDEDCREYPGYLSAGSRAAGTACWAYRLMPDHVLNWPPGVNCGRVAQAGDGGIRRTAQHGIYYTPVLNSPDFS
ncbi:MAG: hypothetical protein BMS9Abin06_0707 [Gammaproteobacteria bacterium]|nr:MAG: hypothetical protein BMS9Abin06_0707 [Gammaproteobacteria bacterium]